VRRRYSRLLRVRGNTGTTVNIRESLVHVSYCAVEVATVMDEASPRRQAGPWVRGLRRLTLHSQAGVPAEMERDESSRTRRSKVRK
jgi:hypothetical protein